MSSRRRVPGAIDGTSQPGSSEETGADGPLTVLLVYAQSVFWSMGEGKGAIAFSKTLEILHRRGHGVHVFLPSPDGEPDREDEYHGARLHFRRAPGRMIPRARLPLPHRLWERYSVWRRYQNWAKEEGARLAKELKPDLFIALGDFEAPVASALAQQFDKPNVTRFYGDWLPNRKNAKFYANFPTIAGYRAPATAYLVTNDGSQGDVSARLLGVPQDRFYFLRNGLDFERFQPGPPERNVRAELGLGPNQPMVMTATRLSQEKKLERVIDAFPQVLSRIPEATLVMVGDGEDRPHLEEQARALDLTDRVLFPGAVTQDAIADYCRSSQLLVSILDRTNASNPVFEAMACGLPVLALDTGSTSEVVEDGESGWLLSPERMHELPSRIADLLETPSELRRVGHQAARRIRELLVTREERLDFELRLYEAAGRRQPLPKWTRT